MKKQDRATIEIGASLESIASARRAILEIIEKTAGRDEVAVQALKTLGTLCRVGPTSIHNSVIS